MYFERLTSVGRLCIEYFEQEDYNRARRGEVYEDEFCRGTNRAS